MKNYQIDWRIELSEENEVSAAEEALSCITEGTAKVFRVTDLDTKKQVDVDLCAPEGEQLIDVSADPKFPNGIDLYLETFYEIVAYLTEQQENKNSMAYKQREAIGSAGMYDLAKELASRFESEYAGTEWGVTLDYNDTMELFLAKEEAEYGY
jgi:hypothetical protein